jgi:hypothetical protein
MATKKHMVHKKKRNDSSSVKQCLAYTISLNKIKPHYDGQWQGMAVASDGVCYFGSSTHSYQYGAGFFRFDPAAKQLEVLAEDMTSVCGEDIMKTPPQGKIHSPIVEHNGWLYFATHLSNYWEEAMSIYPGAHLLGYEMATRKFRDFGVIRPRFSLYSAVGLDPQRNKLYVFVVPWAAEDVKHDACHLYQVDIVTGEKRDFGRVIEGTTGSYWFFVDDKGDCWFTFWQWEDRHFKAGGHGNLFRGVAETGNIEKFAGVLPECRLWPDAKLCSPDLQDIRCWSWAFGLPGNRQCLFTMGKFCGDDERLWLFDPRKNIESGEAFRPLGFIGQTFFATALAGNRLYFVQRGDLTTERGWIPELEQDKDPDTVPPEDLHLRSVSLDPKTEWNVFDHGQIVDQDGRCPRYIDAMAAGPEGRVYMVGGWHILPGEQGTLFIQWQQPNREFRAMQRGQFFAYADVSKDLNGPLAETLSASDR